METNAKTPEQLRLAIAERKAKWCRETNRSMLFHLAGSVRQFGQAIRWGGLYPEHLAEDALEITRKIEDQFEELKELLKE